ncbi:NANOG neighbor homeobox [Plecturocebus cupreus]
MADPEKLSKNQALKLETPRACSALFPPTAMLVRKALNIKFRNSVLGGEQWLTPVIPALWDAKVGGSQGQGIKTILANMKKLAYRHGGACLYSQLLGRLRQENHLNQGGGGSSEPLYSIVPLYSSRLGPTPSPCAVSLPLPMGTNTLIPGSLTAESFASQALAALVNPQFLGLGPHCFMFIRDMAPAFTRAVMWPSKDRDRGARPGDLSTMLQKASPFGAHSQPPLPQRRDGFAMLARQVSNSCPQVTQLPQPLTVLGLQGNANVKDVTFFKIKRFGQARWLTPIIPAPWEAEAGRSLGQEIETILGNIELFKMLCAELWPTVQHSQTLGAQRDPG